MKRHLATRESIAKLQEARKGREPVRVSLAPENSGLTKEETKKALMSMAKSAYRIPLKLIPKLPF